MSILKRSLVSEDWLTLWIGLFVFILSLGLFADVDVLGWSIKTNIWTGIFNSTDTVSKTYENLPGTVSLLLTNIFLLFTTGIMLKVLGVSSNKFMLPLMVVFFISYFC